MLKPSIFLFLCATLSCSQAWAQSKDKFDPTSVKLDQMENGITNILDRIFKLEKKLDQPPVVEALKQEILDLKIKIASMQKDNLNTTTESATKLNNLASALTEVTNAQQDIKAQIPNLKARLSNVEGTLIPIAAARRIVKNDTNDSAKIFRISTLGPLIDDLPMASNCGEIGSILSTYSDRSYNTAFVKLESDKVSLCTYETGRWQVFDSDEFAPGHVVTTE